MAFAGVLLASCGFCANTKPPIINAEQTQANCFRIARAPI